MSTEPGVLAPDAAVDARSRAMPALQLRENRSHLMRRSEPCPSLGVLGESLERWRAMVASAGLCGESELGAEGREMAGMNIG